MSVDTNEAVVLRPGQPIAIGQIVTINGHQFRVTNAKPNGRLFLKLVKHAG